MNGKFFGIGKERYEYHEQGKGDRPHFCAGNEGGREKCFAHTGQISAFQWEYIDKSKTIC